MKTENFTLFLNALTDGITKEQKELYIKIIQGSGFKDFANPEEFYHAVLYPFKNFVKGFIKTEIRDSDDVEFIMMNSNFIERNFCRLFEKYEGPPCCADKSRSIIGYLMRFYKDGTEINFDYTQEYTFHLPKKIFKTHAEIIAMYEGLRNLYYGNPVKYLESMNSLIKSAA